VGEFKSINAGNLHSGDPKPYLVCLSFYPQKESSLFVLARGAPYRVAGAVVCNWERK